MIKNKCKKIVSAMLLMTMIATMFSVDVFAGGDSSCVKVKEIIEDCYGEKEGKNLVSVGDVSGIKVENNINCEITFNGCCGCCCKKDSDTNSTSESEIEKKVVTDSSGKKYIADKTFIDRKDLVSVFIPDSVTSIGREAFANCTNLKTVSLPNRSVKIGDYAFAGCEAVFEYRDECKERK